jgi:hypothetical protein
MNLDNPNGIEFSVSKNSKQRRTFLKRATAGAVVASIPGRSAWAGIAGSIVASGHGSDFNQGVSTRLLDACEFDTNTDESITFSSIFGGNPFNSGGKIRTKSGVDGNGDLTIGNIFTAQLRPTELKHAKQVAHYLGVNSVNVGLVLIYLNAINNNGVTINYPVISQHGSNEAFALYLYNAASSDPGGVGTLLNNTIETWSDTSVC